ncbi:MAG: hypothetical protein KDA88_12785 [Planctomycetaceae bacterium]|nr:hypothetical protein [Planctomycetaceae bacterium]
MRRFSFVLLMTFLTLACIGCQENGDAPKTAEEPPATPDVNWDEVSPPEIALRGVSEDQISYGYTHLLFEVTNPNSTPLPYIGYTRDSYEPPLPEGTISPLYSVEFLRDGAWVAETYGWCGMGRGNVELAPQETVTFDFPAPHDDWESFRIGIDWGNGQKVWSNPVPHASVEQ